MRQAKILLLFALGMSILTSVSYSNAAFTDTEVSTNNFFGTGSWNGSNGVPQEEPIECRVLSPEETDDYPVNSVGTTNYTVTYTVVRDSDTIVKFEDAMYQGSDAGLGEDGAIETDRFYVNVTGNINETVSVLTKAGRLEDTKILDGEGSMVVLDGNFTVGVENLDIIGQTWVYTFNVTSDGSERTPALSHVDFGFCLPEQAE